MLNYAPNSFMGVNYNSPTIQNMIQQGTQPVSYSTSPNIMNIGGQGYNNGGNPYLTAMQNPYNQQMMMNGGYYSGYYGYDPQLIRQQIEEQQRLQQEQLRNEINLNKLKARIYNTGNGIESDDDYLEKLFNPNTYAEINKDLNDYEEMRKLSEMSYDPARQPAPNIAFINQYNQISQANRAKHPVDQSLADFLNTAGDIYCEALINENAREMRKNIANTYDREAYNQLANMHRQSSFASLRQNVSVDDLSIGLPDHLRHNQEYQERKNQFLNFITQHDVRNQGGMR